ncbi:hydrogenase nickel incorporation protein HypB [Rhodoferax sp.]|uniref:hydrogenase nickel incorporation protein HypB n=1 Tax=Rhodoferax sp. TaxID=50421 RepID=UPI001A0B7B4E|nr:hydrogenase nickel incorporation protein HypB [Rhodoferax sp.]MBE0472921.1 hydrogenase nickel incorporation protein HypB [Rhodoferax sp.]
MCVTCGCGEGEVKIEGAAAAHAHEHVHADGTRHSHKHPHEHGHVHDHDHDHEPAHDAAAAHSHAPGVPPSRMVQIEQDILAKNNAYAQANRQTLAERGIFALNLVSSPGSGKTTLLCKTIELLGTYPVAVIEGDQQTSQDAERIRASGAQAIQINTGKGCHLDAHMVGHAMTQLKLTDDALLLIENVGNLVCPAAFDLGEAHKVVILSVTEGEDKPIKYPDMFRAASLMLLNKIDLLPHLQYDVDAAIAYARRVNPQIRVIQLSATSGEGMGEWLAYLRTNIAQTHAAKSQTVASLQAQIAQLKAQLEAQAQTHAQPKPNAAV